MDHWDWLSMLFVCTFEVSVLRFLHLRQYTTEVLVFSSIRLPSYSYLRDFFNKSFDSIFKDLSRRPWLWNVLSLAYCRKSLSDILLRPSPPKKKAKKDKNVIIIQSIPASPSSRYESCPFISLFVESSNKTSRQACGTEWAKRERGHLHPFSSPSSWWPQLCFNSTFQPFAWVHHIFGIIPERLVIFALTLCLRFLPLSAFRSLKHCYDKKSSRACHNEARKLFATRQWHSLTSCLLQGGLPSYF